MEILSDSLFRGNVVVGKAYGNTGITTYNGDRKIVIGSCSTNSQTEILRTDGILRAGSFVTGTHSIDGNRIIDDSKLGPVYYTEILRSGMFTNPKIPQGCTKFVITTNSYSCSSSTLYAHSKRGTTGIWQDAPHVIQVRKVENDETFDINVKIAALGGSSEYLFERSSTDEIPAGYFKTTVIGVELNQ